MIITVLLLGLSLAAQTTPDSMAITFVKLLYSCSAYHPASPLCGPGENPTKSQTITVNDKVDPDAQGPKPESVRVYFADGTNVVYVKAGSGR